nr:MAG TPA: hypothetical protein [Caudoviricetes sp.]
MNFFFFIIHFILSKLIIYSILIILYPSLFYYKLISQYM